MKGTGMKKIKWVAQTVLLVLLLTGCSNRKALRGLKESAFLYTKGQTVVNGEQDFRFTAQDVLFENDLSAALKSADEILQKEGVNSIRLCLAGAAISLDEGGLSDSAQSLIQKILTLCAEKNKFLIVNISEYPEEYSAWYEDSDFQTQVGDLWANIAEKYAQEKYLGAYELGSVPRPTAQAVSELEKFWQAVADAIRKKDAEHLLIVDKLTPVLSEDEYGGFPYIRDRNFMYAADVENFEFYTQQMHLVTEEETVPANLIYPNRFWYNLSEEQPENEAESESISFATTDYQSVTTEIYHAEGERLYCNIGAYVEPKNADGGGELRVGALELVECDAQGKKLQTLYRLDSTAGVAFYYYNADGDVGDGLAYEDGSAYLESISTSTNFYVKDLNIPLEDGKYYQLTVTMKQRGMNSGFKAKAYMEIRSCTGHNEFDRTYLTESLTALNDQAKSVGVPILFTGLSVSEEVKHNQKGTPIFENDVEQAVAQLSAGYVR